MHNLKVMQLAALAMSEPLVTETLPPVGYEQSLRPARRHSLTTHPDNIEYVLSSEAHIGLRDDLPESGTEYFLRILEEGLPNPYRLEDFIAWTDERGYDFDLGDWLDNQRCSPEIWFRMFSGDGPLFWWTDPRPRDSRSNIAVNGRPR